MKYDYLVVGAGLYGSIFAYEANKRGKKVLVVEKKISHWWQYFYRKYKQHKCAQIWCSYISY